ncbi:sigma-70 family RNA polymerase sigma factor [Nonomuraea sp. NPDC050556]|uniref:sigma-70 family RNA polymerase sigma factor n=1 Tax=Nonomuraea sp. NPDC050556 TaxID=3364369 RepID=UPI0037B6DC24
MTEEEFAGLVRQHERELRVHCYRMLGSLDESQDLVQETFLRAWRGRAELREEGRLRGWLYRIATNACLDFLERSPRPATLQPYPDRLLEPDAAAIDKETIELAFIAAIQHLSAKERAVLILRDVLGWSARETAELLGSSVGAVNSGLQRARVTMRTRLPRRRLDWTPSASAEERAVLQRYMSALERADEAAVAAVLREDAVAGHQAGAGGNEGSDAVRYEGRDVILKAWAPILGGGPELRFLPAYANRQPAAATYLRLPGGLSFEAFALSVLRVEDGAVAEIMTFGADLFPAFGLPGEL